MSEIKTKITKQLQQLQMLMHRASSRSFIGGGKRHNPYRGQGRVLLILKMKPEIRQRELGYLLDMSKQSLAELLAKLERSGYITREPLEEDKRGVIIKLTEGGLKAADGLENNTVETSKILDCLHDEELDAFSDYLGRIVKQYEEQFPDEDYEERHKMREEFIARNGRDFDGHDRGAEGHPDCRDEHGYRNKKRIKADFAPTWRRALLFEFSAGGI